MRDPANSRFAIVLGFVFIALIVGCCGITLLGWIMGGMNAVS